HREAGVVLVGAGNDTELRSHLKDLNSPLLLDLLGKSNLRVSAEIVRRARAVVTNDSAPLHLASAMKTPTVALFCATVPEFGFGPWHTVSENVGVAGLSCRPCRRHGGNSCPTGTHACRINLTPEMVLSALDRLLKQSSQAVPQ